MDNNSIGIDMPIAKGPLKYTIPAYGCWVKHEFWIKAQSPVEITFKGEDYQITGIALSLGGKNEN